jgi:hypothetical protein
MFNFTHPYFGNIIGRFLVWAYSGKFQFFTAFSELSHKVAPVYKVKRLFPFWMNIIGQSHGEYIFIHEDYWDTAKGKRTIPHEYVHVWQSRTLGWWGLKFIVKYIWYLIRYGYEKNPFEVEAVNKSGF